MKAPQIEHGWVGVDIGKGHYWVCLIDDDGTNTWSSKVANDRQTILEAIDHVVRLEEQSVWAVDVKGTMSGLLLAGVACRARTTSPLLASVPMRDRGAV
jgi:predicted NBD/HSP70 family sugar kinase